MRGCVFSSCGSSLEFAFLANVWRSPSLIRTDLVIRGFPAFGFPYPLFTLFQIRRHNSLELLESEINAAFFYSSTPRLTVSIYRKVNCIEFIVANLKGESARLIDQKFSFR
jgi:hypothetical protein